MYLYPDEYKYITECINKKREERQELLDGIMAQIRDKMKEMSIEGEVNGRPKHFYSIYKKMNQLHIDVDQIYDLLAVRIIVDSVKDCYTMLGEVHTMWKPIPGRFKDYIAMPKANNYQSLHTTVVADGETFEIQIRTYTGVDTDLDNKVRWLREVMDAEKNVGDAKEFMDAIKINVFDDEVFVFTPKGDVYDLPVGSTPVDLAYKIHSAIGNKCTGAKINRKIVPLSTKLQTGDIVEILTQNGKGPSLDWLKFVKTSSARARIRQYFKKEQREENVVRGKDMLEREARRRGFSLADLMQTDSLDAIMQRLSVTGEEDLYANVGFGGISTAQVLTKLVDVFRKQHPEEHAEVVVKTDEKRHSKSGVLINGNANFTVRMAQCCTPVPGDEIVGYISRGRGVSVHRKDCPNVKAMEPERLIEAAWDTGGDESFNATLYITAENSGGMLASITAYIAAAKMQITGANIKVDQKEHIADMTIGVMIKNAEDLEDLVKKIKSIHGVIDVRR